ncbi:MAG: SMC-Scp complex subunit ScpB [Acidobacteriaceae bacterium]|nr:SMC-Scp complex subunit ScpB [Acidobacteriaceae bacterium]
MEDVREVPDTAEREEAAVIADESEERELREDVLVADAVVASASPVDEDASLKAIIEAAIYVTDEPLSAQQIATAIEHPLEKVTAILERLVKEYSAPDRGLSVRELAGGYKMSTKPEHHEAIRLFVKKLQPPVKLSLAALETLAVIAYKQPITAPEIMDIRGVQGAGVLKTLLDRKLIATAGRKNVVGKPMMYKTTREFLIHFGLSSLTELPTLKEFEELGRLALADSEELAGPSEPQPAMPESAPLAPDAPEGSAEPESSQTAPDVSQEPAETEQESTEVSEHG